MSFINKHIAEYKGKTEEKHRVVKMIFESKQDAEKFADKISAKINVPKEHITVKARKYTR
jgi:hypothetical protein